MTEISLKEKVATEIEQKIRPALQSHGGDVELVDVDEANGIVKVRLQGACCGCPGATATLKMGIETTLKEAFPEVKGVEPVQ